MRRGINNTIIVLAITIYACCGIVSCAPHGTMCSRPVPVDSGESRCNISPQEACLLLSANARNPLLTVLDVRTEREFNGRRLKNARNCDVCRPGFTDAVKSLDRSGLYVVYCQHGLRSSKAVEVMRRLNFTNVHNIKGGIERWIALNLPDVVGQ
jgi:rhodanese-related sulfurtransferase